MTTSTAVILKWFLLLTSLKAGRLVKPLKSTNLQLQIFDVEKSKSVDNFAIELTWK